MTMTNVAPLKTLLTHTANSPLSPVLTQIARIQQWNDTLSAALPHETELLRHCVAVSLENHVLTIVAENPHWVTRFRFLIPDLLENLRKQPAYAALHSIRCKVSPPFYGAGQIETRLGKKRKMIISANSAELLRETAEKVGIESKLGKVLLKLADKKKE